MRCGIGCITREAGVTLTWRSIIKEIGDEDSAFLCYGYLGLDKGMFEQVLVEKGIEKEDWFGPDVCFEDDAEVPDPWLICTLVELLNTKDFRKTKKIHQIAQDLKKLH